MIKYIKVVGKKIVEVRPLLPKDYLVDDEYIVNPEVEARFDKEFLRVNIPDDISDIVLLQSYYYQNGKLVKTNEILDRKKLQDESMEIQIWLEQNDWIPNKIITDEWEKSDERWINYLSERKAKRTRLDEIRKKLEV